VSELHATTGIGTTLFVLAAAGAAITVLAIALDHLLDRLGRRRDTLPRATVREQRSDHGER